MRQITEKEYKRKLKRIQQDNLYRERNQKLREERRKGYPQFNVPSTSKLVLFGVIVICIEIIIFCEWAMIYLGDLDSMYVLIGIPAALAPTILGYYNKSKAENTEHGITYETAMAELRAQSEINVDDDDDACG